MWALCFCAGVKVEGVEHTVRMRGGGAFGSSKIILISSSSGGLSWGCLAARVWEVSFVLFLHCFHFWTEDLVPNAYRYLSASSVVNLLPSGSSNAMMREEVEPDLYEAGG